MNKLFIDEKITPELCNKLREKKLVPTELDNIWMTDIEQVKHGYRWHTGGAPDGHKVMDNVRDLIDGALRREWYAEEERL